MVEWKLAWAAVQPHEVPVVKTGHIKSRPEKCRALSTSLFVKVEADPPYRAVLLCGSLPV